MRFKKGTMVEVFCQTENPAGSWRCGEILRGNGHSFTVKYCCGLNKELIEERVPRKFIRPSSPKIEFLENWRSGDVIEVLHNFSWKMATVSRLLSVGTFLVRLVGFFDEFEVSQSDIRLRQSWVDGKWVVIGKSNNENKRSQKELLKNNQISWSQFSRPSSRINLQQKPGHVMYENINVQSSSKPSTRMQKRKSPNHLSKAEVYRQKFGQIEKDDTRYPVYFKNLSQGTEKVKSNTFDRDVLGENIVPSFPYVRMRNLSGTNEPRTEGDDVGCSPSVSSENYDNNDATCSTSYSSVCSNDPFNWTPTAVVHPVEIEKDYCSDAESICWSRNEETSDSSFTKGEMAAEIHRLELHAYRCTMEALYASGPFSWEQESLMTNLRISLHISNDEHLMELRILISNSRNSPPIS